jgi:hypothetical protein
MYSSTAGTGADVSQFAVITDTTRHTKITIISRTLVPEISIVDPRLLITMPDELNAATGLDALTHAIEAFVSRAHNRLTDQHALHAAHLVMRHLPQTLRNPRRAEPRICQGPVMPIGGAEDKGRGSEILDARDTLPALGMRSFCTSPARRAEVSTSSLCPRRGQRFAVLPQQEEEQSTRQSPCCGLLGFVRSERGRRLHARASFH